MCTCECRHMMRWVARVEESSGFCEQLPVPNRIKERVQTEGVSEFEVGAPTDGYYRRFYLDNGESFSDGLRSVYTLDEAWTLFRTLDNCRCCSRHRHNRPHDPFLPRMVARMVPRSCCTADVGQ